MDQVGRRQRLQNFGLNFRFEVIENAGGVSAFGIAEAFNCLVLKFREDLVAELAVRLGQRGAIELGSHHLDEPAAQLRFEQGSEQAEVGLVWARGERAHPGRVARLDRAVFIGNWRRVARDAFQFRRCRAGAAFNPGHARFFACRFGSKVNRIFS